MSFAGGGVPEQMARPCAAPPSATRRSSRFGTRSPVARASGFSRQQLRAVRGLPRRTRPRRSPSVSCRRPARDRGSPCSSGASASCTRSRSWMNWNAGTPSASKLRVVGRRHRSRTEHLDAEILQRLDPRLEDRPHGVVALHPDAANLAGAVVDVEVDAGLRELRFGIEHHALRGAAPSRGVAGVHHRPHRAAAAPGARPRCSVA